MAAPSKSSSFEKVDFLASDQHSKVKVKVVAGPQRVVNGLSAFTLPVTLPRNAVVQRLSFVVTAKRAGATAIETVAQYRVSDAASPDLVGRGKSIVVDFGSPRTVSAVQVPRGLSILRVTPWIGASFAPSPAYAALAASAAKSGDLIVSAPDPSTLEFAFLPSEIRTERLLLEIVGDPTEAQLAQVAVVLPEAPNDLEIRIDGGAPVWKAPGPAQQGTGKTLTEQDWNEDGQRLVDLSPAFAALTGDPTATDSATFELNELCAQASARSFGLLASAMWDLRFAWTWDALGALGVATREQSAPFPGPARWRGAAFSSLPNPFEPRVALWLSGYAPRLVLPTGIELVTVSTDVGRGPVASQRNRGSRG